MESSKGSNFEIEDGTHEHTKADHVVNKAIQVTKLAPESLIAPLRDPQPEA